jgi:hypothetical protein
MVKAMLNDKMKFNEAAAQVRPLLRAHGPMKMPRLA